MALPSLIGLAGKARTGKTTVAQMLQRHHGYVPISFADPIKEAVCLMFGITRHDLENPVFKETVVPWIGKSPRQLMQLLGTEYGRDLVKPTLWADIAFRRADDFIRRGTRVVIVDCRFENEASGIRERGKLIHVRRYGANPIHTHVSEAGVARKEADSVIVNEASLEALDELVRRLGSWI